MGEHNGFAQWEEHCREVGHTTKTEAYDRGLIVSLHGSPAKKYAGYSGNPLGQGFCTAPKCKWASSPRKGE